MRERYPRFCLSHSWIRSFVIAIYVLYPKNDVKAVLCLVLVASWCLVLVAPWLTKKCNRVNIKQML